MAPAEASRSDSVVYPSCVAFPTAYVPSVRARRRRARPGGCCCGIAQLTHQMPFGIIYGMKTSISIDKAGRVVLPQHIRRQFHLVAGDRLDLELQPDGIFLRSHAQRGDLVEDNGLLVHEGEPVGDLARAIELDRASRDADVLGVGR